MPHNTRVRPDFAAWAIGTGVSAAEFEKFDANLFKAINGDDGGTWAPSAAIAIGGEGMRFVGSMLSVASDGWFEIHCDALFGGASQFTGLTSFTSGLAVSGTGSATFGVPIVANAAATFNQSVTIGTSVMTSLTVNSLLYAVNGGTIGANSSSTFTVNSAETHNATETHNGAETHAGTVAFNGATSVAAGMNRVTYGGGSITTDQTVAWDDADFLTYTTTTNGLTIILQASGTTPNGVVKHIKNSYLSTVNIMVVNASTAQQIGLIAPGVTATFRSAGGAWL